MIEKRILDGMQVAIIVTDDFEQVELTEPRTALERVGANTMIVAPHAGSVQGMKHDEKAGRFPVDLTLLEAHPDEFDAVVLPGGALNADQLRMVEQARAFVRAMDRDRKPIAVICHAPWLLVSAGLVKGRRLTSYFTIQDDIRNAGGSWEDREVVVDGNLVTSRAPRDIPAFNAETIALFAKQREKAPREQAHIPA
jgi:protease I